MNWFFLSVIALLCWSGSDLFSKIGCRDSDDRHSHLKMTTAVGVVMGLHAAFEIFVNKVPISWGIIWTYLPVSALYIVSMALGYIGLRYIELSISSPICNSSGALAAIFSILFLGGGAEMVPAQFVAVGLTCLGVIGLGIAESTEDETLRAERQSASNYKYAKSWIALALPVVYCVLDAAGSVADSIVLESLDEASANVAYELTFLAVGTVCFVYTFFICREKPVLRRAAPKYIGAAFETAGQLAYIMAIADKAHFAMSAPIIASYCAVSVVWSRIFLKEKLSWKHYLAIGVTVVGIVMMGVFDM